MSDNNVELQAKVSFSVDQASASAAKAATDSVVKGSKSASDAAQSVKPPADAAAQFNNVKMSSEKAFGSIEAASRLAEGNIMGVVSGIKSLGGMLPKLASALGPIGLLISAFSIWKGIIDSAREAHAKLESTLRSIRLGNLEQEIIKNAEAYEREAKAIDRVADSRRRLSNIEQAKDDAVLAQKLAQLDYEQAIAKGNANPDDSIGQRKIDLDFSTRKAVLQDEADRAKNERQQTEAAASLSDLMDKRKLIQSTIDKMEQQFRSLSGQQGSVVGKARRGDIKWTDAEKELSDISKQVLDLSSKLRSAYEERSGFDTPIAEMRGMREVYQTERQTAGTKTRTREVQEYVQEEGIIRDRNKEVDSALSDLNDYFTGSSERVVSGLRSAISAAERNNNLTVEVISELAAKYADMERRMSAAEQRARRQ